MKINSSTPIAQLYSRPTEASNDKQGGSGQNQFEQQQNKKNEPEELKVTEEKVEAAIETFSLDEVNSAHGIHAEKEGSGPGLKVVLKNAEGGVLRSVSGEEFLKLREAIRSGNKSGRILDQKA